MYLAFVFNLNLDKNILFHKYTHTCKIFLRLPNEIRLRPRMITVLLMIHLYWPGHLQNLQHHTQILLWQS